MKKVIKNIVDYFKNSWNEIKISYQEEMIKIKYREEMKKK